MSEYVVNEFRYRPSDRSALLRSERSEPGLLLERDSSEVCVSILPVGVVETRFTAASTFVDVNVAAAPTSIAVNSDKVVSSVFPPKSFGFIPRGTDLYIKSENNSPCVLFEIGDLILEEWLGGADIEVSRASAFRDYRVDPAMGSFGQLASTLLHDAWTTKDQADVMTMEAIVLGMSARLIKSLSEVGGGAPVKPLLLSQKDSRLQRSVDFARAYLSNPQLKVSDLANEANMSVHHYSELFKQWQGMSPYAFIRSERLKLASEMLTASNKPIATIAYDCGFSSQAHFTTAFKSFYGVTPGKVRR